MGSMGSRSFREEARPALFIVTGILLAGLLWVTLLPAATADRQQAQWPELAVESLAAGLDLLTGITHAGDGSGRLFLLEQQGTIRIYQDGALVQQPFLDISERVLAGGEQGLLGLAFPPGFAEKQYFYVNYTDNQGDTVIARYSVSNDDPDRADADSEVILLSIEQPEGNHNGGQLAFGPDGYLYIGMGDGGGHQDPNDRAQDPGELLGKLLRIDVETPEMGYGIPPTNPFTDSGGTRDEIWALGLRNPWRFSFDRQTGDLFIADVGEQDREEVNFQPAGSPGGENYGWNCYEGTMRTDFGCEEQEPDPEQYVFPVHEYSNTEENCSITGGFRYRGDAYPGMQDIYFYGDYCSGRIWGLRENGQVWENNDLTRLDGRLTTFGEDEQGELYAGVLGSGGDATLYRVVDTGEGETPPVEPTPTPEREPAQRYLLPMINASRDGGSE